MTGKDIYTVFKELYFKHRDYLTLGLNFEELPEYIQNSFNEKADDIKFWGW